MDTLSVITIKNSLQIKLQDVPQEIRHWFGSEKTTLLIMDINQKLKLVGEDRRIIPKLLLRLEVKDLNPQYFTSELSSQLKITHESAKFLAKDIEEKILEPIRQPLLEWGVDAGLIEFSHLIEKELTKYEDAPIETEKPEMGSLESGSPFAVEAPSFIKQPAGQEIKKREAGIMNNELGIMGGKETAPIVPPTPIIQTPPPSAPVNNEQSTEGPMIIHEETQFKPIAGIKKSLGGLFGALNGKEKMEEKPVRAEIGLGNRELVTGNQEKEIELPTPPLPPQQEIRDEGIENRETKPIYETPQTESTNIKEELSRILSAQSSTPPTSPFTAPISPIQEKRDKEIENRETKPIMETPKVKIEEIKTGIMNNEQGITDKKEDEKINIKQEEPKTGFLEKTLGGLTSLFGKKKESESAPKIITEPAKRIDYSEENTEKKATGNQ